MNLTVAFLLLDLQLHCMIAVKTGIGSSRHCQVIFFEETSTRRLQALTNPADISMELAQHMTILF